MKITIDTQADSKEDIELAANFLMQIVSKSPVSHLSKENSKSSFDLPTASSDGLFDFMESKEVMTSNDKPETKQEEVPTIEIY